MLWINYIERIENGNTKFFIRILKNLVAEDFLVAASFTYIFGVESKTETEQYYLIVQKKITVDSRIYMFNLIKKNSDRFVSSFWNQNESE